MKKLLMLLGLSLTLSVVAAAPEKPFKCQKLYPQHLQGVACDNEFIYWSFSNTLVKTDWQGREILAVPVKYHHGDLCYRDGKIYVAVNYGKFNQADGRADNYVLIYNADDLKLLKSLPLPEIKHGAGAISVSGKGFMLTGGLPTDAKKYPGNLLYEYDENFKLIRQKQVAPWTLSGVQTILKINDGWLLGCHVRKLLFYNNDFKLVSETALDVTHGIMQHPASGKLFYAQSKLIKDKGWEATVYLLDAEKLKAAAAPEKPFNCQKRYPHHLQGVTCDNEFIYWSFGTTMVKTDWQGNELLAKKVRNHHGDLCYHDGKVYVAVNYGKFNQPDGRADNYVLVYNADDLELEKTIPTPEIKHGSGAMARSANGFMITGGLPMQPEKFPANLIYEYDNNFKFIRQHSAAPWTLEGVQTIQSFRGGWLLGCHRSRLIFCDADFKFIVELGPDATHGLMIHPASGRLYRAQSRLNKQQGGWQAVVYPLNINSRYTAIKPAASK